VKRENKDKLLNRLSRIEGQVRGVARMVEEDRYCIDVLTQLQAVRAALTRVESEMLKDHLGHCIEAAITGGDATDQRQKARNSSSFWGAAPDDDPCRTRPPRAATAPLLRRGRGRGGPLGVGADRDGRSRAVCRHR
jgi:DNA-binding FrmR family transcriptional regulator